jgi:glycosyltransferase involved in cell wall biosynthesis
VILFVHHRYRISGGEERAVADLLGLVRDRLGEDAELLERDSGALPGRTAGAGLLAGGLAPEQVARAVRHTGARIVHAHNLLPTLGWRSLAAARSAGARVVLHLHQYRLVCAIGVCFREGHECTECHATHTSPGVRHGCRGSRSEALTYAAALALWQRRLIAQADVVVVPSAFAGRRLHALGAPIGVPRVVPNVVAVPESVPGSGSGSGSGSPVPSRRGALVVSRLAPEKGVDVAIEACARAGLPLTIAGDGPQRGALEVLAGAHGGEVTFLGRVGAAELAGLRARAAAAVVPSRSAETFGLAAAEAMAAGLPVAASRIGALPELVPEDWLASPGDPAALAEVLAALPGDPDAGERARAAVRAVAAPDVVAAALRDVYARAAGD